MRRKRNGVSLIETIVVLAIICILMAFYLPALVSAKKKAIDTRDYLEGRTTPVGKRSYAPEDLGRVVDENWGPPPTTGTTTGTMIEVETTGETTGGGTSGGYTGGDDAPKESKVATGISPQ